MGNLDNLGYEGAFLYKRSKTQSIKEIIDKLYFIKLKFSALQKTLLREF